VPEGLSSLTWRADGIDSPVDMWRSLVRMILALSGVEAVANMTGLMKEPVASTAKKTIWPVLAEVILFNMLFAVVILALPGVKDITTPSHIVHEVQGGLDSSAVPELVREYRDTAVKILAENSASHWFGPGVGRGFAVGCGLIFGLLLLSAVNTAVVAMVSVMYSLAQDRELPRSLSTLNYSGVPWIGLIASCVMSAVVLVFASDARVLGDLYAVGVVGAIAINVLSCAYNRELPISRWQRGGMWVLGSLMGLAEITILLTKPHATMFCGIVVAVVLAVRAVLRFHSPVEPVPEPEAGWMSEIGRTVTIEAGKPRIMLAARGRDNAEYAVDMARRRNAVLFTIFVRVLRVMDVQPGKLPRVEDDPQAQEALGSTVVLAKQAGVPCYPIYVTATNIADEILDYTVTFACDTLIMGKSRRSLFARTVEGDVIGRVAGHLPEGVSLVTRSGRPEEARESRTAEV
jgi:nucleotide-binding universal stress UspA family protein